MNRRAGATDRHALLAGGAYPSSSSLSAYRSSSPYENPYASTSSNGNGTYHSSDFIGAPKKEPPSDTIFGRATSNYTATRTAEDLEEQNDSRLDGLTARVSMLKEITLNIGTEVREGTKELGTLGEAFENTSAFLGGTFKRMNKMAKRQGGWFCNMMLFLLFVTWLFVSSKQRVYGVDGVFGTDNIILLSGSDVMPIGLPMVVEKITSLLLPLSLPSIRARILLFFTVYLYRASQFPHNRSSSNMDRTNKVVLKVTAASTAVED